jgi:hypothetical protein
MPRVSQPRLATQSHRSPFSMVPNTIATYTEAATPPDSLARGACPLQLCSWTVLSPAQAIIAMQDDRTLPLITPVAAVGFTPQYPDPTGWAFPARHRVMSAISHLSHAARLVRCRIDGFALALLCVCWRPRSYPAAAKPRETST